MDHVRSLTGEVYEYISQQTMRDLRSSDLQAIIANHALGTWERDKPSYGDVLPVLSCVATGGETKQAIPLASAWVLYNLASNLFDDLQDQDGKDIIWNGWKPARAMQAGLGLIAAAQWCLAQLEADTETKSDIWQAYARTLAVAAHEQNLPDNSPTLRTYFRHTIGKSGIVLATVVWSGARIHTDDEIVLRAMSQYGSALGTLIQLLDDCQDLQNRQLRSDFMTNPYSLPVIYALSQQTHPKHATLKSIVKRYYSATPSDISEVCTILDETGATTYVVGTMKVYEQKALAALNDLPPSYNTSQLAAYASSFLKSISLH